MSEKKLFVVSRKVRSIVLAENIQDACHVASQNAADIMEEADRDPLYSWHAFPCKKLLDNWCERSLPWASLDEESEELPCSHYLNKEA